jgi:hypothetical protein
MSDVRAASGDVRCARLPGVLSEQIVEEELHNAEPARCFLGCGVWGGTRHGASSAGANRKTVGGSEATGTKIRAAL